MFILASSSAARRDLLKGFRFRVVAPGVREVRRKTLRDTVLANARLKAASVARKSPGTWVLAADTMLAYGGRIYGKPKDRKAAVRLLRLLAGGTHVLGTAVVLQKDRFRTERYVTSRVTMRPDPPVEKILRRYDPTRFAGGYAIRPEDDPLIEKIEGSVSNVVGLPMERVRPLLEALQRKS